MAAATKDRDDKYQPYLLKMGTLAATTKIYKGTLVGGNAAGYLVPGSDTAGLFFLGVAMDAADNSAGAAGAVRCRVRKAGEYEFAFGAGNAAQANLWDPVFLTDDQTVDIAATTTNDIPCGYISEVISATKVRVVITGFAK